MAVGEEAIIGERLPVLRLKQRLRAFCGSTAGRFLMVGGASYVVNQALLIALYEGVFRAMRGTSVGGLDAGLLLASLVALEASIVFRFVLNDGWTFRGDCGPKPFQQRLLQSNFGSLGGPAISLACVNLLTPLLGVSYLITNSAGIALGLGWNWLWSRHVVWRPAVAKGE